MTMAATRRSVIFAGGGTGGHLFPGIAVARELFACEPDTRVLFVGSQKPIESEILSRAGFEHIALPSVSPSLAPTRIVSSLLNNWRAYRQARAIMDREQPSVVVGLGGFASVPPVLAAWRAGVPIVLLEQNVVPGKATRWLSRFANVVCLPWPQAANGLPRGVKTIVTGNPIRAEIAKLADEHQTETQARASGETSSLALRVRVETSTLLILGGSQGAASLNAEVLDALATFRAELAGWRIVHQTGVADLDAIRQRYAALSLDANVQPFIVDMADAYRSATIVISRAGATTLAELACAGVPAILVPLATSAHDHQRLNARLFADRSAALMIEPPSSVANSLGSTLTLLLSDSSLRDQLRQNLRPLAQPQAAITVVSIVHGLSESVSGFQMPRLPRSG
jgi:UDP-N-acetylglucosamine--N-acetylmuramyl-(pentapeptide) pyrophosphoryl-undecaprenol N-acetylglucosamine transferase